jgi:hypothetical protein
MSKTLNRDLFFARAYYFSFMGGWGFILPFINLFYIGLGLSGTQIGTITSTSSVAGLLFAPIIVSEVKKQPQARGILQVLLFLGAVGYYLLGKQTGYFPILVIVFFQALVGSSVMPVSDSMALSVSKESGSGYGGIRVFASIGWIITVLASGWLIERFDFGAGFIGVSLMWIVGAGFVIYPTGLFCNPAECAISKIQCMDNDPARRKRSHTARVSHGFDLRRIHEQRRFTI